jgi:hypothetical protein
MVKCGVLFEVRTEFLNIIKMSTGFKGLMYILILSTRTQDSEMVSSFTLPIKTFYTFVTSPILATFSAHLTFVTS